MVKIVAQNPVWLYLFYGEETFKTLLCTSTPLSNYLGKSLGAFMPMPYILTLRLDFMENLINCLSKG